VLADDASIIHLAKAATQMIRSHTVGDRVIREMPSVHLPSLERIVNVDQMIAQLDAIASAGPEDNASDIIRNFKLGLNAEKHFGSREDEEP